MNNPNKILIIDDEDVVLDSCTETLEDRGYVIATAADGAEGLRKLQEFQPDLVFIDLKMPGLSGFDVLDKIRKHDATIVAIVITGYATVGSAIEAMSRGAFDFLPKPFTPAELRMITSRGLEKRRLVLESISLRREKEMLRENFAAVVSHELKAPLSAVQQNLFALAAELEDQLSDAQKARFERMKVRLDDLLKQIQMWLRMVSVDVSSIADKFAPVSIAAVLNHVIESLQSTAARKAIEITVSPFDTSLAVFGDEVTLREALLNVVGNAIQYSPQDGRIRIDIGRADGRLEIAVADSGLGIAGSDLPHIFDDFYRGQSGRVGDGGCGLGLAITRRIVEAHHGSITAQSEPGRGSTFVIRLPLLAPSPVSPPPSAAAPVGSAPNGNAP